MIKLLKDWYKESFLRFLGANIVILIALVGFFITVYVGTPATLTETIIGFFIWFFGLLGLELFVYYDIKRKIK